MFNRINAARNAAIKAVALKLVDVADRKIERIQEKEHDAMIAESQAKIGPYKPASVPVQVWA